MALDPSDAALPSASSGVSKESQDIEIVSTKKSEPQDTSVSVIPFPSLNPSSKLEFEQRVALYQFYMGSYIRGIAFFLAINAVLFKFAIDSKDQGRVFSVLALLSSIAILVPLIYSFRHRKEMEADFNRLAKETGTQPISMSSLFMLSNTTAFFWVIIFCSWIYMLFR